MPHFLFMSKFGSKCQLNSGEVVFKKTFYIFLPKNKHFFRSYILLKKLEAEKNFPENLCKISWDFLTL